MDYKALKARQASGDDIDAYYYNIVEEVNEFNDWCISEDTSWGIPIPYFTYRDTGEVLMDAEISRHVANIYKKQGGSDAWFTLPLEDLLPPRYKGDAPKLTRGDQVFDVWFDNALSWGYVLGQDYHEDSPIAIEVKNRLKELSGGSQEDKKLL